MWPRDFSILILIMEMSATKGLLNLDLDNRNCLRSQSWQRNYLQSQSWRRKCLRPKDLILTKEMSVTKGLDLDEGDVCDHDLDLDFINVCDQWIWSWLRKCLRLRSWSWLHKCLRPIDLILIEEIKGFLSLKPSWCLQKPKFEIGL